MKISDLGGWHQLTYGLVYPAILGSMLYDVLKMPSCYTVLGWARVSIVVFYCLDYMHLHSDLKSTEKENVSWCRVLLDLAIAIFFGFSYWFVGSQTNHIALIFLFVIAVLMFAYKPSPKSRIKKGYRWGLVGLILVLSLAFLDEYCAHVVTKFILCGDWRDVVVFSLPTVWYSIYVFLIVR